MNVSQRALRLLSNSPVLLWQTSHNREFDLDVSILCLIQSRLVKMSSYNKPRVIRLRNVPGHLDRLEVTKLLAKSFESVEEAYITVFSLAYDVNPWSQMPRKVATLTFERLPASISYSRLQAGDVRIDVPGLAMPLIFDCHFRGITPLNEIPGHMHTHE